MEIHRIDRIYEIPHKQYKSVIFHACILITEFLFNQQEGVINYPLDLDDWSFG